MTRKEALEVLLALAICSYAELSCEDCPRANACNSWDVLDVIEAVAVLKGTGEEDPWIPVEKDLPKKEDVGVLAVVNGRPTKGIVLKGAYQVAYYSKTEGWIIEEWPEWTKAEVTHWMELPEPPEGVKEE